MACLNCTKRHYLCHMDCEDYKVYQKECEAKKEYIRKHRKTITDMDFKVNILRGLK